MNIKSIAAISFAAIAFTGIGAGVANAQSISWDSIAQCESGGDWHIDTGNGYYGGLQFSESTWLAYGGGQYAGNAAEASKSEQISIAEKVLAGQGISAWPVCGVHAYDNTRSQLESEDQASTTPAVQYKASKPAQTYTEPNKHRPKPVDCNADWFQADYTIVKGDTLSGIGEKYGVRWITIYNDNKTVIHNPNLIYPGQKICIPNNVHTNN